MGSDEHAILEYLKRFDTFVSPTEIAKRVGGKRRFMEDRDWVRPILHRMLNDDLIECNEYGHCRIKPEVNGRQTLAKHYNHYYSLGRATYVLDDDQPFWLAAEALRRGM